MSDTALLVLWACVGVGTLALGAIALRSANRLSLRLAAVAVAVGLATSAYAAGERVLGRARPVTLEIVAQKDDVQVLYAQAIPQQAIYLLIETGAAPLYYRVAWSEENESQLRGALQEAQEGQTALMMRMDRSLDEDEPMFYAEPQPALPAKDPAEPALRYSNPEWRS